MAPVLRRYLPEYFHRILCYCWWKYYCSESERILLLEELEDKILPVKK